MTFTNIKKKIKELIFGERLHSTLERKNLIILSLMSSILIFVSIIVNIVSDLPLPLVAITIVGLFITGSFYIAARKLENYQLLKVPGILLAISLLVIIWFLNGGIDGPMVVLLFVYLIGFTSIFEKKYRFIVFILFLTIIVLLLSTNYLFPEWIETYTSRNQRYIDLISVFSVAVVFIYVLFELVISNYENENKKVNASHIELKELYDEISLANQKLRKSEEKLRSYSEFQKAILDNATYAIITTNSEGIITSFNRAAEKILGYSAEEVINKETPLLFHDRDELKRKSERFLKELGKKAGSEIATLIFKNLMNLDNEEEWTYISKNGKRIPMLVSVTPLTDKDGKTNGYLAVAKDISEKKLAEQELKQRTRQLKESEEKYRTLFTESRDPLLILDGNVFIDCNNAALEILKLSSKDELREMHPSKMSPAIQPCGTPSFEKAEKMIEIAKEKGSHRFEWLHQNSEGKNFYVEVSLTVIPFQERQIIHTAWRDITERKNMMREIVKAKEKAEVSEKIKTEFLAQMSHEIRSPLNVILNFVSLIKEEMGENIDEDIQFGFKSIDSASQRIIRTIDLILNMTDLQSGSYESVIREFDAIKAITFLITEYKGYAATKNIELRKNLEFKSFKIHSDEYALTQVFGNLIDNAIKYTNEGYVEITATERNGKFVVSIKDTGIGISAEFLPKLFSAFTQEEQGYSRSYDGNGLGMALVKRYCDLLKAEISVESEKGKGTTFTVVIPDIKRLQ